MFLPYKVDVPMARVPWANWLLIAVTIIISVPLFSPIDEWSQSLMSAGSLQFQGIHLDVSEAPGILHSFILQPSYFHPVQLVGQLFAHDGWGHLLGNMFFLWLFGNAVNAKIGHWQYLVLYFGVGVLEGLMWLILGPHLPTLGASGAIMGIVGAFLLLYPLNDVSCWFAMQWRFGTEISFSSGWLIAAYVVLDFWGAIFRSHEGVAYLVHVVGFLAGAGITTLLLYRHILEPARGERTLLQALGLMPDNDDDLIESRPIPIKPLPRPPTRPRDTSPIPLD